MLHSILQFARWISLCCTLAVGGFDLTEACAQGGAPVVPELDLRLGHIGAISSIAYAPDGKTFASASVDRTIKLWDVRTGVLLTTIDNQDNWLTVKLAFSPNGSLLAAAGKRLTINPRTGGLKPANDSSNLRIWDAHSGRLLKELGNDDDHTPFPVSKFTPEILDSLHKSDSGSYGLAFSPDGKIICVSVDTGIKFFDVRSGELNRSIPQGGITQVAYSPSGLLVAGGSEKSVFLWDARTGRLKCTLPGSRSATISNRFSLLPDGKSVASIRFAFSPDGRSVASILNEKSIQLWDARSGKPLLAFNESQKVVSITFSLDGKSLLSTTYNIKNPISDNGITSSELNQWIISSGQKKSVARNFILPVNSSLSPDGLVLTIGALDGSLQSVSINSGESLRTIRGANPASFGLLFSSDGKKLLCLSDTLISQDSDVALREWNISTGMLSQQYRGKRDEVMPPKVAGLTNAILRAKGRLVISRDEHWGAVIAENESEIRVARDDGDQKGKVNSLAHPNKVTSLSFSADGALLVTTCVDNNVRIWNLAEHKLIRTFPAPELTQKAFFYGGGKFLVSGSPDAVRFWNAESGDVINDFSEDGIWGSGLVVSPDETTIAIPGMDGIILIESKRGELRRTGVLLGHKGMVLTLAFSLNGKHIASGGLDGTVKLWDVADKRLLATMVSLPVGMLRSGDKGLITIGDKGLITIGDKDIKTVDSKTLLVSDEWFVLTPEGYFDCSTNVLPYIHWRIHGESYAAENYLRRFKRPDLVGKILRSEPTDSAPLTSADIPPTATFVGLKNGDSVQGDSVQVALDLKSEKQIKVVEFQVNGRFQDAQLISTSTVPSASNKPAHLPLNTTKSVYKIRLPVGGARIAIRATAFDERDLGSDAVDLVLKRSVTPEIQGNLYVLSVGVSHYRNADNERLKNLMFPEADALAVAERLAIASNGLYKDVKLYKDSALINEKATRQNVLNGLKWLQDSVRGRGGIDTVIIFLSGHGTDDVNQKYHFATHDTDLGNLSATSVSGSELKSELTGKAMEAKNVFLFVDSCHAGGLPGNNRNLANLEDKQDVFLLGSSSSSQSSFENSVWKHGAFTKALLDALNQKELQRDGSIRFADLGNAVIWTVRNLMVEAGHNVDEQNPVMTWGGDITAPVVGVP